MRLTRSSVAKRIPEHKFQQTTTQIHQGVDGRQYGRRRLSIQQTAEIHWPLLRHILLQHETQREKVDSYNE